MAVTQFPAVDVNLINLSRLLSRLEKVLSSSGGENDLLRRSGLERKRVGTVRCPPSQFIRAGLFADVLSPKQNLDYARTLLFRLEQESYDVKAQQKRQHLQADLAERKELISHLNEQLYRLNELDEEEGVEDEEGEDLLGEDGTEAMITKDETTHYRSSQDRISLSETSLDRRKPFKSTNEDELESTYAQSDQTLLFGERPVSLGRQNDVGHTTSSEINPALPQTEKLLSHNRTEQEELTASLLSMAQALKESSQAFSSSLESEKGILDRTSEGLEKNTTGMASAEKRMGSLRRMTEGRGWLGRMLMYAWIMGLMMVALIIVGFLPKLRF